jgi:hypothetical protein
MRKNIVQNIKGKEYKTCSKCGLLLRLSKFRKDSRSKTGLNPICKKCKSELYDKKRYKNTRDILNTDFTKLLPSGIFTDKQGYRMVMFKGGGITIPEHRWIMMKALGRSLKSWEFVHHKNKNRSDNRLENLELTPFAQQHELQMHEKSSITMLIKENSQLRKRIKELEDELNK